MVHHQIQLSPPVIGGERPNQSAATADFEFAALREARNYRAALLQEFSPHLRGDIIEVGSGIGQFTEALVKQPSVRKILSIEPDPGFCRDFRERLPGQSLIEGTIDQVPHDQPWQAILSLNVLEHILDDEPELSRYQRLLASQCGELCLFVPARPEIYAPIDRDFGHHRRYTKQELRTKLERAGFEVVRLRYFNCVGYLAWWFNFCLLKKRSFDAAAVRFFDRAIFPSVFWFESNLCAPPIGQSLLAVARARR